MLAGRGRCRPRSCCNGQADNLGQQHRPVLCILAVSAVSFVIFRLSAEGARWLSPIVLRLTTRIMGLLLAAIAIQFAFDALAVQWGHRV